MKIFKALNETSKRKDNTPLEKLNYSRVSQAIEDMCKKYLQAPGDVLRFEAAPGALDATLACLESPSFLDKYNFNQVSDTCFDVAEKVIDIFG